MNRKEFIKICGLFGLGLTTQPLLSAFSAPKDFKGNVLIIGAGAAGLSAGYLLQQQGIEFQILEASSQYGGRMKRHSDFANFPIPLGAEWLHTSTKIFDEIVNDESVNITITTKGYDHKKDYGLYEGYRITVREVGFNKDRKFINATWFDFFEQYIVPSISEKISYNKVVTAIDYSQQKVVVQTENETFSADKVIFTAPLKILQSGSISFKPQLPTYKQKAISNTTVWDGCKAFIEFSEKFYPTFLAFEMDETQGQKLYYDAAYGQNTSQHILGLFAVGKEATFYNKLKPEDLIKQILAELDNALDGQASKHYIKHIFQNWNKEPHIHGAYASDQENWARIQKLGRSVDDKLFFAGTAYTDGSNWGSVDAAAVSAQQAVSELLG